MDNVLVRGPMRCKTNLEEFQKRIETRYKRTFVTYWEFHQWSIENYEQFWAELWDHLGILCSEPYKMVIEPNKKFEDNPKWFLGARLNYTENMLNHPDDDVALILTGEQEKADEIMTFGQLREEVSLLTSALRKAGLEAGDIVASYKGNGKQSVASFLATAAIGALLTTVTPLVGMKPLINRFKQLTIKVLFAVDKISHDGVQKDVLGFLPKVVESMPSLELVVIVPFNKESLKRDIGTVPKSIFYDDFIKTGRLPNGQPPKPYYEQLSFNHPLTINFTSGTTGLPKGAVHSAGAAYIGPLQNFYLSMNVKRTDVMFTIPWNGGLTWAYFLCGLSLGAAQILYDGFPHHDTCFWDIIDKYNVTIALMNPSVLEKVQKDHILPGPHHQLNSLHTIISGSTRVQPHLFDLVYKLIKPNVFFSVVYGATEMFVLAAGINHSLPVYKEQIQTPALGYAISCYNEEGQSVMDKRGELVITQPFPTMPLYFANNKGTDMLKNGFFTRFPGVWRHGDLCSISSKTRGMIVYGRTDDVLKQGSTRFGPSDIYCIVNPMEAIADTLCVGRINKKEVQEAVLFVKMKDGNAFTPEFVGDIRNTIIKQYSVEDSIPRRILQVKDIPYNVNGKRVELLVKKILAREKNISFDAVRNQECLQEYIDIANSFVDR